MKKPTQNVDLLKNRINFYAQVSKQPDVFIEIFEILEHHTLSGQYFIHIKYVLKSIENSKEVFSKHEELETFAADRGWIVFLNQSEELKLATFLKSSKKLTFNVSEVSLK